MFSSRKIVLFFFFILSKVVAFSQCAMCKAVVESDLENGGTTGSGINNGIIYLILIPYALIGTVGYLIYKHYKKNQSSEQT